MEKITLEHPKYGHFEALGETEVIASKKCLKKIAEKLLELKLSKQEIKTELTYATNLLKIKLKK